MNTPLELATVPEEMRCKYPSKRCDSARVLKRDGEFHRFCEFHRLKANKNQQRLEQRRRMASPRAAATKRTKRSMSAPCKPLLLATSSSPTSVFDPDVGTLPALHMDDLDLDLLGDLLDFQPYDSLHVDDTHAALHLLDGEAALPRAW